MNNFGLFLMFINGLLLVSNALGKASNEDIDNLLR